MARSRNHFAAETTIHCVCVCVIELHVTVKYTKVLGVTQQCCYGPFMSPATMQIRCTSFLNKL
jgi:hypothetical protein